VKGAVLAVGTELLLGDVINSNAAWLGRQLAAAGIDVIASAAVGDDHERLVSAIESQLAEAEVLVLCGGLGPTVDDLTREAIAQACDRPLQRRVELEEQLRAKFVAYGIQMPEAVLRQADVPRGAEVLENPAGTAPGLWLETDGQLLIALPGPPQELRAVSGPVWPRLRALSGTTVTTRQVLVCGIGESQVAEMLEAEIALPAGVSRSYLASGSIVRVRFTTAGDASALEPLVAAADRVLGDNVWGHDGQTLDGVVHDLLLARGQTVAVAESLTGGLLGAALTARPGSSASYRGGVVVYATDLKRSLAGVAPEVLEQHGVVSEQTALALATGARERLGADWGLAVTGVAGPDEQEGQLVGTVFVGVAGPDGGRVKRLRVPGDRERVRSITVTQAMDQLRRHLLAVPVAGSG
jgi:nicotinamide-nucleotide amidase